MRIQKRFEKIASLVVITVFMMLCLSACGENTVAEATRQELLTPLW